jgi:hypothetical protein
MPYSMSSRLARLLASNSTGRLINWKATTQPKPMMPAKMIVRPWQTDEPE